MVDPRRLLPPGLISLGLLAVMASAGLVGHFYTYAREAGFSLLQVAPCLVSGDGICSFQLCATKLARLSNHASEIFWAGIGLASIGLFLSTTSSHPLEPS